MTTETAYPGFKILGADNMVYGPVELPTLKDWVKDERITRETWIFQEAKDCWQKAIALNELQDAFPVAEKLSEEIDPDFLQDAGESSVEMNLGSLRRIKVLGELTDAQLRKFAEFVEMVEIKQFREVVKQGDHGDSMYMVLQGELRVRLIIDTREKTLANMAPGEFFGEISLFDQGPRSADVVANQDSVLLRLSESSFLRMVTDAPDLAARFLLAIGRTLTSRIRADNKRYRDTVVLTQNFEH
ncbi:MAG: Crp/Fnr family transcriptional regulator [Verrucomicrobiales bacterium]|nr:Crp/Fnr family transcriptional regulator [Verrucomicrobiales bacterium]MDB6129006.1 Crp/Fnr family transcriptional regulator [Verrucomicrobiales bacterium]